MSAFRWWWLPWLVGACDAPGRLYVTAGFSDAVYVLDAATGELLDSIPVDPRPGDTDEPHGIEIGPAGRWWYVSVAHGEPSLWRFDARTDRLTARTALGAFGAARIGITPDGRWAFVPDYYRGGGTEPSAVTLVDLDAMTVTERLMLCPAPHDARPDPFGRRVAVTCTASNEVVMVDVGTMRASTRFPIGPVEGVGARPLNLGWSPDGGRLYVTLHDAGAVRAFDTLGTVLATTRVGAGPAQLALSPDGAILAVANRGDGSVSVLDRAPLRERARIPLDVAHPHGVVFDTSGRRLFVVYEGDTRTPGGVVAVDLGTSRIRWRRTTGAFALGAIYLPPR